MDIPNMSYQKFISQKPDELFLFLSHEIYKARKAGHMDDVAQILSVFSPDERRALLIGSGCLLCMDTESDYSKSMRTAICKTVYKQLKEAKKT